MELGSLALGHWMRTISTPLQRSRKVASIQQDPQSKQFRIRFRFGGRRFFRSLKTAEKKVARSVLGRVEETLRLIDQGRLEVPSGVAPGQFILSDGKINNSRSVNSAISLSKLFSVYRSRLPDGAKEPSTIRTEKTHITNLLRLLPGQSTASSLSTADVQRYVEKRLTEK